MLDRAEVVVWPQRRVDRLVAALKTVDGDGIVRRHSVLEFRYDLVAFDHLVFGDGDAIVCDHSHRDGQREGVTARDSVCGFLLVD